MKQPLLFTKAVAMFAVLLHFNCANTLMAELPNMNSLRSKVTTQLEGIPSYMVQPRNYELNFSDKIYYNIQLGDFVSDHDVLVKDGKNKLYILTNNNGECRAIADYISSERKGRPEQKYYELIAENLYPKGNWVLGIIGRYSGIYCVENNIDLSIYYTGDYLVVKFSDTSLESSSITDELLEFNSIDEFIAYQEKMGATPEIRKVNYLADTNQQNEKKQNWLQQEDMLDEKRFLLYNKTDSFKRILESFNTIYNNSIEEINLMEKEIPTSKDYQILRSEIDNYNLCVDTFTMFTNKYMHRIDIVEADQSLIGMPSEASFARDIEWIKKNIHDTRNKKIAENKEQEQKQRNAKEQEKELSAKYGESYKRYKEEGYYTGMSFDLVRDVSGVLLSKGIVNGVNYYEGPFNLRFGFRNKKLVYFSGYF